MKTVLIIGGYGQFGQRLSRRLASLSDIRVLVAGRNIKKAEALCISVGGNLEAVFFDTYQDITKQLSTLNPSIVVNAVGPFQTVFGADYALANACIDLHIHYLDLSDSGTFTKGIDQLDARAKAAGITVISGASSVPALSSAITDAAQLQFAKLDSIEGGISPGGRIDIGLSVTQAVLSYLGKPLKVFRGGQWGDENGYSRVHKHTISIANTAPLHRKFGLCDAPDLLLFPDHYSGVDTVRFFGSQELWIIHISLRVLAWLHKKSWVKNLQNRARFFQWWGTQLGRFASERGGMFMRFHGTDTHGKPQSLHWNLIASDGDGPFIPILACEILIKKWLRDAPRSGARSAVSEISLAEFEAEFRTLSILSAFTPMQPAPYLYEQVLGEGFKTLPPAVQAGHKVSCYKIMTGRVDIQRGTNPLTNLLANIIGFAKTRSDAPITIHMDVQDGKEVWTRIIDGKAFRSTLSKAPKPNEIYEQFGPIKFKMLFRIANDKLHYDIVSARVFSMPYPKFLLPKSVTHECEENECEENSKFIFDVDISLPLLGRLIAYKGWLE
ncbi:MAG: hypothetical protein COA43_09815 [Robiginitomaculum sp.]|nr:MAG: hypothetical protein COA43_09815 [Robiginitomaculum sp.]